MSFEILVYLGSVAHNLDISSIALPTFCRWGTIESQTFTNGRFFSDALGLSEGLYCSLWNRSVGNAAPSQSASLCSCTVASNTGDTVNSIKLDDL